MVHSSFVQEQRLDYLIESLAHMFSVKFNNEVTAK